VVLNLLLIVLENALLAAMALVLHAKSRKYGLAPLLLYLAGLVTVLQMTGPMNLHLALWGTSFIVSSATLVPVVLMTLLILYEAEGTAVARLAIIGVIGLSLLVLLAQLGFGLHMSLPGGIDVSEVSQASMKFMKAWPKTLASILSFSGSLLAIVIVYQALSLGPRFLPSWAAPGLALLAALTVDELLFSLLTQGFSAFSGNLATGVMAKVAGGLLIAPVATGYLHWVAPTLEGYRGLKDRRPLEVVFGSYRTQESVLRATRQEQKQAEEALRASEIRFRTTFEQVGVGLAHIDLKGQFLRVNKAFCQILGYPQEEIQELTWQELTHPEDLSEKVEEFRRLLRGDTESYEADKRYLRKDGSLVSCFVTVSLVRNQDGGPQYFVASVEDLTERNATAEHLRQAQKMEAVGQLTGGIAHDFNNLLTVIMGGIQLALAEEDAEPLEEALQATRRGAELTHRLLAFSSKQSLKPVTLHPVELLENMQGLLTRTLGETVRITMEVDGSPGVCLADAGQMENAILNLALNARDAMSKGGEIRILADRFQVEVEGDPVPEAQPGEFARISVVDEGTGIPESVLDRIFDPFFTTKAPGKGSGLGLSMVYGFARQSGGFVTVESRTGLGTSVRLHLPVSSA